MFIVQATVDMATVASIQASETALSYADVNEPQPSFAKTTGRNLRFIGFLFF